MTAATGRARSLQELAQRAGITRRFCGLSLTPRWRGSNPVPSRGESSANPISWIMVGADKLSLPTRAAKLRVPPQDLPGDSSPTRKFIRITRNGSPVA
jgi:hypothetical protein